MPALLESLNRVSPAWAGLMGAVLWQSTVLVLLITLAALLLRHASPRLRYWLWQIVAIKLLLMPFWVMAVPLPFGVWAATSPTAPALPTAPPVAPLIDVPSRLPLALAPKSAPDAASPPTAGVFASVSWSTWLLLAWAGVVLWRVVSIARQRQGLGRLLRLASPADAELNNRVQSLARQLGLKRGPDVVLVDNPGLLFVCGLWGPRLVVPRSLPAVLRSEEMEQVILHELAHLRRGDLYWGWTIELARIVYFFHPAVYWVAYCLHLERELACDQVAMATSGHAAGDYAQTLVRVASHASQPAVGTVSMVGRPANRAPSKEQS